MGYASLAVTEMPGGIALMITINTMIEKNKISTEYTYICTISTRVIN